MSVHVPIRSRSRGLGYDHALRLVRSTEGAAQVRDPASNRAHILASLDDALEDHGRRAAWPHQAEAIGAIAGHFRAGGENAICVIPTAGGKTEVFQRLVAAAHRTEGGRDMRTIVLVPTRQLIVQTVERFRSEFPWLPVGFVGKGLGERWAPVTVMTYARFIAMSSSGRIRPGELDLLVMDEAHRGLSTLRQGHFRRFIGTALVAAFSATPVFDVNKNVYRLLGGGNEVIHVTVARLIAERRIAPVVNVIVGVNLVGDVPDDPEALSRVLKAASVRAMLDIRADQGFPELSFTLSERSFVAYAFDIDHGAGGAEAFNAAAGREGARAVSYLTEADEQRTVLEDLAERRIDGVFNAMVFLEGTDIPTLGSVYNLAPTTSLVRQMQRSGRALRLDPALDPADPRQTGVVVDFFFRINGRMLGRPVFYCDAIGDRTIARAIETAPLDVTPLLEAADGSPQPAAADAESLRRAVLAREAFLNDADGLADGADEEDAEPQACCEDHAEDAGDIPSGEGSGHADPFPAVARHGVTRIEDILARLGRVRVVARVVDVVSIAQERDAVRFGEAEEGLTGRTDLAIRLGVSFETPAVKGLFDGIEAELSPFFRENPQATATVVREGVSLDVCYRRIGYACWPQYRLDQLDRFEALCGATFIEKGDAWLGQTDIYGSMGNRDPWRSAFRDLIEEFSLKRRSMRLDAEPVRRRTDAWRRNDPDPSNAPGAQPVRMALVRNGNSRVVCFHRDDVPNLRLMVGLDKVQPSWTEGWLGFGEITEAIGLKSDRVRTALHEITRAYDEARGASFEERDVDFRGRRIRFRRLTRHSQRTFPCVHRDSLHALVEACGVEIVDPVGADWTTRNDLAASLGVTPFGRRFQRVWNGLVDAMEAGGQPMAHGRPVRMRRCRHARTVLPCIHRDDAGAFRAALEALASP